MMKIKKKVQKQLHIQVFSVEIKRNKSCYYIDAKTNADTYTNPSFQCNIRKEKISIYHPLTSIKMYFFTSGIRYLIPFLSFFLLYLFFLSHHNSPPTKQETDGLQLTGGII